MAVEIVYETHATTTDNEAGIATGWLPGQLSELGRSQAAELGERRRAGGFAEVFTSDLHRAVETARIAFPDGTPSIRQDIRLRECNYGDLNGTPVARIAAQRARRIDEPFPGGQSYRQVLAATNMFLHDLATRWDGGRILVIAHSANRWALDCLLAGASLEDLVEAPPAWRPGWHYMLPTDWTPSIR
ncbi:MULTISPECIES: histidine phosphatase family protein [unclassified Streptomyces]|uniref:histidine phosphatase family protein n=1 Tax=unclassified Streptomyces TaxID=2593676 RepID=UPI000DBAD972|nr:MULTISPECIES: histidine phosphatase family protein [unclassified Streptomyces]MYT73374.1 histidine phosphatase family protein [Streptomyces sp. SID8367]RAJ70592.1 alpha-ribazole phosphatase/probable phosphoglycerate mutase [Streptomyces sp. PsTaAH-137]